MFCFFVFFVGFFFVFSLVVWVVCFFWCFFLLRSCVDFVVFFFLDLFCWLFLFFCCFFFAILDSQNVSDQKHNPPPQGVGAEELFSDPPAPRLQRKTRGKTRVKNKTGSRTKWVEVLSHTPRALFRHLRTGKPWGRGGKKGTHVSTLIRVGAENHRAFLAFFDNRVMGESVNISGGRCLEGLQPWLR